jgi:DNA integrity scanning protein DisA with diadenylate cyclase activity
MIPEEMQRTMQFLLENQATHDARLAAIEISLEKLSVQTSALASTQQALARTQQEMQEGMQSMQKGMQSMQGEFREGLQKIVAASEQTLASVRGVAELEARTIKRVNVLEDRVDTLENSSE